MLDDLPYKKVLSITATKTTVRIACTCRHLLLQDDDDDEPEILDLPYTNISKVLVTPASAANHPDLAQPGQHLVEMQCTAFPECLGEDLQQACETAAAASRDHSVFTVGLVLQESQLNRLLKVLRPQVRGYNPLPIGLL